MHYFSFSLVNKFSLSKYIVFGLAILTIFSFGMADTDYIEIEVAKLAAANYLPIFYEGEWEYFAHFIYYGLEGKPSAYAVIFSKAEMAKKTIKELKEARDIAWAKITALSSSIKKIAEDIGKSGKQKNTDIENIKEQMQRVFGELRGIYDFSTVVTGAVDSSPVVLKCHKGLPQAFIEAIQAQEALSKKLPQKNYSLGKVFYFGPFDIAYELIPEMIRDSSRPVSRKITITDQQSILLYNLRTNSLISLIELREIARERKQKELLEEDIERIESNKDKWAQYKRILEQRKRARTESVKESKAVELIDKFVERKSGKASQDVKSLKTKLSESSNKDSKKKASGKTPVPRTLKKPKHSTTEKKGKKD